MAMTPTGVMLDRPPASSLLDIALPVTDLDGVNDQGDWARGVALHYRSGSAVRWRHQSGFDGSDPDITAITDPSVWPAAVSVEANPSTDVLASFPYGIKSQAEEAGTARFRAFSVYAPRLLLDLAQSPSDAAAQAAAHLRAHLAAQMSAELADSLYTKNPGLYLSATDVSGASAVDPAVAIATLYEAHGIAGGSGDAVLHVPYHAVPFLVHRSLAAWDGNVLRDCYRNPIHFAPGLVGLGPLTDPTDLETAAAPGSGEGYFYLTGPVYAAHGTPASKVDSLVDGPRGVYTRSNEQVALAEAPAIVLFKPDRVHACLASLNEVV